ncbi:CDP-diacylglycerol--serine O-phosphatidyltransferase [Prosthecochloris sp. GSB1]|uniref:CDP-diacylglycerol--serine O-phosphatidyltransferase n=1 Tax=Prosthecochloris sp. GSB1 TaxID=281093 RepID=UPI000B8C9099|nr:CDP-diacylglycerol--serine O-phosphatidyltransferase [Prosthecochloris sp. GSB1]ASQ90206.1 CDP-diacylglycerol--serine O-phosphatidyltransferase [Prosthecochloris sp. GSB1]
MRKEKERTGGELFYPPFLDERNGSRKKFRFVSRTFVPSAFTVMNMVCGYVALVMAGSGEFATAAWFIVFAAFFDTVDGFVARITNTASRFGVELDSLSDLVSFGAAPAYLVYTFGLEKIGVVEGILLSSMLVVGSGLRLARFNIRVLGYSKDSFCGLPSPAQALTIAAFVLWTGSVTFAGSYPAEAVLAILTVGLSILMVSTVNYDALPKLTVRSFRERPLLTVLCLAGIFCVLVYHAKAFFVAMLLYILLGIFKSLSFLFRQFVLQRES